MSKQIAIAIAYLMFIKKSLFLFGVGFFILLNHSRNLGKKTLSLKQENYIY